MLAAEEGCEGELQRSCSRAVAEKVSEQCQLACHCRRYPPLPPPPPPPPPPRLLSATVAEPMVPLVQPWWMDFLVLGTVGCASVVFLLSAIIICYKAIKSIGGTREAGACKHKEEDSDTRCASVLPCHPRQKTRCCSPGCRPSNTNTTQTEGVMKLAAFSPIAHRREARIIHHR
ncbi:uncharacterized protein prima1 isoform X2 [Takifugu flavidus]|nr:uncharacterized protein prima1 isoform X2 [Takifugu flavidus]